jgi:hypothetical protein
LQAAAVAVPLPVQDSIQAAVVLVAFSMQQANHWP